MVKKYTVVIIFLGVLGFLVVQVVRRANKPMGQEVENKQFEDPTLAVIDEPAAAVSKTNIVDSIATIDTQTTESISPATVNTAVPFTSQAPFAEWDDERQQSGCEEASTLMAAKWVAGESLTAITARRAMTELTSWENETFGFSSDTNAKDTARILTDYFKISNVTVSREVSLASIRSALQLGMVVIVPTNGQALMNPYFSGAGPERHMLVITGYDDSAKEFIVNDPGTKRGAGFHYSYDVLLAAIREYPSGVHQPIISADKTMILVGKPLP